MSVLIGEDRDGNRFYNLNNKTYTAENSSRVIHAKGRAEEEFFINILTYNSDNFNPKETIEVAKNKYTKVFDYIKIVKEEVWTTKQKVCLPLLLMH